MRQRDTLLQRFVTPFQICRLFKSEAELRAGQCAKHQAVHLVFQVPVGLNGVLDRLHNLSSLRAGEKVGVWHGDHSVPTNILFVVVLPVEV